MVSLGFQKGNGNFVADVNGSGMRLMLSAFFKIPSLVYRQLQLFSLIFLLVLNRSRRKKIALKTSCGCETTLMSRRKSLRVAVGIETAVN